MPNSDAEILEIECPSCGKRLKAGKQHAGKRVKCPKCGQPVKVPGIPTATAPVASDDWLSLDAPAITDVSERERVAAEVKAKRAAAQAAQHKIRDAKLPENNEVLPIPVVVPHSRRQSAAAAFAASSEIVDDEFTLEPFQEKGTRSTPGSNPRPSPTKSNRLASSANAEGSAAGAAKKTAKSTTTGEPSDAVISAERRPSIFDEDLPELADLTQAPPKPLPLGKVEDLSDLDTLIPDLDAAFGKVQPAQNQSPAAANAPSSRSAASANDLRGRGSSGASSGLGSLLDVPDTTDHEYRVACKVCGTAQYVRLSAKGMKMRCPDCTSEFRVPPPPPGWSPKSKPKLELTNEDMPMAAAETFQEQQTIEGLRTRTTAMLAKAEREISDDELDGLYASDFDTAGFMQRTFGFMRDPIAMSFVLGYGFVFACVFALAQYGLNNADSGFGRGALLLGVIGAPLIGILFGLPMLSGALALLESVANRQPRVVDWPGFNVFDNFGDMLSIAAALLGAMLPGYMLGAFLGGDQIGAGRIQITGLMLSTYLLFPILFLSILDNGSLFQPLSNSVLSSFKPAAEAWGGYYLKTMIAFFVTMLLWYMLLGTGKSPWLVGAGGFLVPPLVFFTFQQLGALADGISEHLSFEFTPGGEKDADEEAKEGE